MPDEEKPVRRQSSGSHGLDAFQKSIANLEGENAKYRARHREMLAKVEGLEAKAPKEGEVVLKKEEAEQWTAFGALKQTPAQLVAMAKENGELRTFKSDTERRVVFEDAAKELGLKSDVLSDLLSDKGFHVEMKEVTVEVDGEKTKKRVPYVRKASDAQATPEPLMDVLEGALKAYLPALKAEGTDTTTKTTTNGNGGQGPATRPIQFPAQRGNTAAPASTNGRTLEDTLKEKVASGGYSA